MLKFITFSLVILFVSCDNKAPNKAEITYKINHQITYYSLTYKPDTIISDRQTDKLKIPKDSKLIYKRDFTIAGPSITHTVSLYYNNGVLVDDKKIYYVLDNIGVFYSCSLTKQEYTTVSTGNDSIDRLLNVAKDIIIEDPNLHYNQSK